jgi:hypothetical protein
MCTFGWQYFATHPSNEQHDLGWHHWEKTWKCHHNVSQTLIIKHMISLKQTWNGNIYGNVYTKQVVEQ